MATHPVADSEPQRMVLDPDSETVFGGSIWDDFNRTSLLRSDALYEYILQTSVYPREHKALQGLREVTAKHSWAKMVTSPDEGQFLSLLLKLMNAKNTIEIGVFTGYSLLWTALALPEDGKVIALDTSRPSYEIGLPYIEEAGVAHKIDFREGPAMGVLEALLKEEKNHGFFDFIFVDADKDNYMNYYPLLLKLVKVGGIIAFDNTLWLGSLVIDDPALMPDVVFYNKKFILDLNKFLGTDPRVEISHLSISDGITLCRRIV